MGFIEKRTMLIGFLTLDPFFDHISCGLMLTTIFLNFSLAIYKQGEWGTSSIFTHMIQTSRGN